MTSSTRALAALATAGVLGVAACGSSSSNTASSKTASSSTSSAPSSSSSASTSDTSSAAAGGADTSTVVHDVVDAMTKAKTGHVDLGGVQKGTEDFELGKGVKAEIAASGMKLQLVAIGSLIYIKGLPGVSKWLKIDPKGTSSMDRAMASLGDFSKSSDPSTLVRYLNGAKGTKVGSETVAGKPTTHYRFTISPAAYAKAVGSGALARAITSPITSNLWVGADNLPAKATSTVTAAGRTVTSTVLYSKWGQAVTISAPPASQVTTKAPF